MDLCIRDKSTSHNQMKAKKPQQYHISSQAIGVGAEAMNQRLFATPSYNEWGLSFGEMGKKACLYFTNSKPISNLA